MSVLYKALARASKARESYQDSSGGAGQAVVVSSRGRRRIPKALIYLVVLVVVVGGGYVMFGDDIADGVNTVLFGDQSAPPPVAATKTPAPAAAAKPQATASADQAQPAAAPAQPAQVATTAPAAPAEPNQAPAPVAAPAATPATPAAPVVATATPATPATQNAEPAQPASAVAAPTPAAKPGKVAAITPEQDLPAILDRIRQQRTRATLEPSVVVNRSAAPTVDNSDGVHSAAADMISVTQLQADERDNSEQAYDMLLHGRYEGALDLYDKVLKVNPSSLSGLLGKAIALHKLRKLGEAKALYQRVLTIDPGNREALTNMTAIVAAQSPATALRDLREMQKSNPTFSPIAAQIAAIDIQAGDMADAMASFNRAIQLSPENGLYRLNLAILQDRAGMGREAALSYQAALERISSAGTQLPIPIETIQARLRYLRSR